jgi:3-oxoacyl-[acyl-carrier-protein] synthase-3
MEVARRKGGVGIIGLGAVLPDRVVTNDELAGRLDTSDEWIRTRTGIRERRYADPAVATSDLAITAGRAALHDAGIGPEQLDWVICATTSPDNPFPATASRVQAELGAVHAAAFDLMACCSGWLYGVTLAEGLIRAGACRHALVIGAEVLSRIINWQDRSTAVLVGDGAGAAVLGPVAPEFGLLSLLAGSDGAGYDNIIMPAGGTRMPASAETVASGLNAFHMKGREVFRWAVRQVPEAAERALELAGLGVGDIDLFVPHQANVRIIEAAVERLGLPEGRTWINIQRYGNISAACIPVGLHEARAAGRIHPGDRLLTVAFGGGLTWAAAAMRWA